MISLIFRRCKKMNKEEFVKALTFLSLAYNKEFDSEQTSVWYEFFKEEEPNIFKTALKRIIAKNKYLPSIAEIKQEIALIKTPQLQLDAEEEWEKVLKAIRKYGYYRETEALETLEPLTKHIVKTIGWYRLNSSENIQWERKEFIEIFNNKKSNVEAVEMLTESMLTLSELAIKAREYSEKEALKIGSGDGNE